MLFRSVFMVFLVSFSFAEGVQEIEESEVEQVDLKVLTIAMFENGEFTGDSPGEAQFWAEGEKLNKTMKIPGGFTDLHYNDDGHGIIVTGMGHSNAAATVMAVGMNERLDLSDTYINIAGIAGVDPEKGTLGSAAWARFVINGDLAHHFDAREMPEDWDYPYFHLGDSKPWSEEGWSAGTEVYQLNEELVNVAYELSKDVELADGDTAQEYRSNYPDDIPASKEPTVIKGDSFSASTYWHGEILSDWAEWWTDKWTDGEGDYAMSNMEDSATLTALKRLNKMGKVDFDRVLVLRTASNFDQPYPGQTAQESINANSGGYMPSIKNAYRVGSAVTDNIIANWSEWKDGVPSLSTVK